ncbi:MAG: yeaP [Anaerosporomusa subterranea]|jgi:diguanylate cyclase (GGDEF)-like protein|nr:yeaP [Anaerosporomusa subterranea]
MFDFPITDKVDDLFNIVPIPMLLVTKDELQMVRLNQAAAKFLDITDGADPIKLLTDVFDTEHEEYIAWVHCLQGNDIPETELSMQRREQQLTVIVYAAQIDFAGTPHLLLSLIDSTEKCSRIKLLEQLAARDDMTGLLNRRAFRESLESTLLKSKEEESEFFLAFMDLDDLKKVNDTYGHREGDWYIKTFTSLLRKALRKTDIAGRVGGDEFAVIFAQCSRHYAEQTIWRLQQQVETIASSLDKPFIMGVSIGLIAIESWMETDADSLLSIADDAMYKQKSRHCRQKVRSIDKIRWGR